MFADYATMLRSKKSLKYMDSWMDPKYMGKDKLWDPEDFILDTSAKYLGFRCWNDFFLRRFREERRPIAEGHDTIAMAC